MRFFRPIPIRSTFLNMIAFVATGFVISSEAVTLDSSSHVPLCDALMVILNQMNYTQDPRVQRLAVSNFREFLEMKRQGEQQGETKRPPEAFGRGYPSAASDSYYIDIAAFFPAEKAKELLNAFLSGCRTQACQAAFIKEVHGLGESNLVVKDPETVVSMLTNMDVVMGAEPRVFETDLAYRILSHNLLNQSKAARGGKVELKWPDEIKREVLNIEESNIRFQDPHLPMKNIYLNKLRLLWQLARMDVDAKAKLIKLIQSDSQLFGALAFGLDGKEAQNIVVSYFEWLLASLGTSANSGQQKSTGENREPLNDSEITLLSGNVFLKDFMSVVPQGLSQELSKPLPFLLGIRTDGKISKEKIRLQIRSIQTGNLSLSKAAFEALLKIERVEGEKDPSLTSLLLDAVSVLKSSPFEEIQKLSSKMEEHFGFPSHLTEH